MNEHLKQLVFKTLSILPDKAYLSLMYRIKMGKPMNWEDPQTFNEKLQWLKLYDRKPEYTKMVDKYEAKKYVADIIGEEYIIPTLGVWDRFDDIDFDSLPNRFVLKCTHDSGGLVICKDKANLNRKAAKDKIERSMRSKYFLYAREWPYKNVKPRIIAEQFMEDNTADSGLRDYKFFCFNGEPQFLYISEGLDDHATACISFVTLDWKQANFGRSDYKSFNILPEKPRKMDEMVAVARKLAKDEDFLRVDLYEINGRVYFSELTFSPCGGFLPFRDPTSDLKIGRMLNLDKE